MSGTTFTWNPDFGAQVEHKPNVRVVKFGDGYEQRAQFGINADKQTWTLQFNARDDAEATAIDGFLQARGAVASFNWQPPGGVPLKFVCRQWKKSPRHGQGTRAAPAYRWDLSATFEQVFEP